jgi:hypothetical protein
VNGERGAAAATEFHHLSARGGIKTADAVAALTVTPDFTGLQATVTQQFVSQFGVFIRAREQVLEHLDFQAGERLSLHLTLQAKTRLIYSFL